jgi:hypothetical protein
MDKSLAVRFLRDAWERTGVAVLRRTWMFYTEGPKDGDEESEEVGEQKQTRVNCS